MSEISSSSEIEQAKLAELNQRLVGIVQFLDDNLQIAESEGGYWIDEDEGYGKDSQDRPITYRRLDGNVRLRGKDTIGFRRKEAIECDETSYKEIAASIGANNFYLAISLDDGKYMVESDGKEGWFETEYISAEEIAKDPRSMAVVDQIAAAIEAYKLNAPSDLERHPLPTDINVTDLTSEEQAKLLEQLNSSDVTRHLVGQLRLQPELKMTTAEGDKWFASMPVFEDRGYTYVVLYRPNKDASLPPLPFIVYTSRSQGTWRYVPRFGHQDDPEWHDKGVSGEASLNLPIQLQATLRQVEKQNPSKPVNFSELLPVFNATTHLTYDESLAGGGIDHAMKTSGSNLPEEKLPDGDKATKLYEFKSPLYGDVEAYVVPSTDAAWNYLIFRRQEDGNYWVGMIEPTDAQMIDSFILDKVVVNPGLQDPLFEYEMHVKPKYEDNLESVVKNVAVVALGKYKKFRTD